MKSKFKAKEEKTKISPITMASVRSARKLSAMTDKVAGGVLGGILYTTGLLTGAVDNSAPGKKVFKMMPGEVALVSLDAFGKVFDALEKAGRDVATRSSAVTQDFVDHRYGDSARELTDEGFQTVGNFASVAWTLTKIRKALNPKQFKVQREVLQNHWQNLRLEARKHSVTGDEVCFLRRARALDVYRRNQFITLP